MRSVPKTVYSPAQTQLSKQGHMLIVKQVEFLGLAHIIIHLTNVGTPREIQNFTAVNGSQCYVIINNLAISWSLPHFGNSPKKFGSDHFSPRGTYSLATRPHCKNRVVIPGKAFGSILKRQLLWMRYLKRIHALGAVLEQTLLTSHEMFDKLHVYWIA